MNKKLLVISICCFLMITGCSKDKSYERDTSQGDVIYITLEEMQKKMQNKDEFVIAFTQQMCRYCQSFHLLFNEYKETHHVTIYEVDLTSENGSESENLKKILKYFPTFSTTPGIYYAKDGKVESSLTDQQNKMDETILDEWVKKYQLDKKK